MDGRVGPDITSLITGDRPLVSATLRVKAIESDIQRSSRHGWANGWELLPVRCPLTSGSDRRFFVQGESDRSGGFRS